VTAKSRFDPIGPNPLQRGGVSLSGGLHGRDGTGSSRESTRPSDYGLPSAADRSSVFAQQAARNRPIVERPVWDKTQELLRLHAVRTKGTSNGSMSSPLTGKLFDETGERLTPSHAVKGNRRYRYYVSRSLMKGAAGTSPQGWRIPASEVERNLAVALDTLSNILKTYNDLFGKIEWTDADLVHKPITEETRSTNCSMKSALRPAVNTNGTESSCLLGGAR
jgi:hypothetical protein